MPIPERVGIEFKVKKQGMFARGLQNLFSNSTSATAPDSLPHVRPRSLDDAQAFVPVAPFEQTPPLPALIPGSPCPSSCPPPLPPKPSSSPPGSRNSNINQVGMAKVEISPPVPPPPPLGPGQVAVDRSQNERQRQSIITCESIEQCNKVPCCVSMCAMCAQCVGNESVYIILPHEPCAVSKHPTEDTNTRACFYLFLSLFLPCLLLSSIVN
jgi:hypothetical protein